LYNLHAAIIQKFTNVAVLGKQFRAVIYHYLRLLSFTVKYKYTLLETPTFGCCPEASENENVEVVVA
jgi:hypothetical protein